jgi:hypothetical protein
MSIISVLAALIAGATLLFIGRQHESNTRTTLEKAYTELKKQWDMVITDARLEVKNNKVPPNVLALAGNDAARAGVIHVKLRLRQQFPMNYTEILSPAFAGNVNANSDYDPPQTYQKALGTATAHNPPTPAESGACLLIALTTKSRHGNVLVQDRFSTQEIADTDQDGVKELVDGWGNPIVFFRWPALNDDLASLNPQNKGVTAGNFQDPGDPTGALLADSWNNQSNSTNGLGCKQFEDMCHLIHDPSASTYTPKSFYLIPVIGSAGPDGRLGMQTVAAGQPDPMQVNVALQTQANDNIYSYRALPR